MARWLGVAAGRSGRKLQGLLWEKPRPVLGFSLRTGRLLGVGLWCLRGAAEGLQPSRPADRSVLSYFWKFKKILKIFDFGIKNGINHLVAEAILFLVFFGLKWQLNF